MDFDSLEFIKKVTTAGSLAYSVEKMINVFDIDDEKQFGQLMSNPDSEVYKAYSKGKDKADFAIDVALYKNSAAGDVEAIKELAIRIARNKQVIIDTQNLKNYQKDA